MPLFFFNIRNGHDVLDPTGTELPDVTTAFKEAAERGKLLVDKVLSDADWELYDWRMEIVAENGTIVGHMRTIGENTAKIRH